VNDVAHESHHQSLHHVSQLAHISGPVSGDQSLHGLRGNLSGCSIMTLTEVPQEVFDQQRNVVSALPQRRHLDWYDVQTVVQVLPKCPIVDQILNRCVGRRQYANIRVQ